MKRLTLLFFVVPFHGVSYSPAQQQVERKGVTSAVQIEHAVSGYLAELNGKYKLRATETTVAPGGYVGEHYHIGPGIRYVASGELTFVQQDKTTIYKAGEYFYESGDVPHNGSNKGSAPVVLIIFEILPLDWTGATVVPPKSQ
jgi:quercetin dioxygenase-like cupin family protein